MANIKITELPGLTVLTSTAQFPVVSSNVTYNVTANTIQTYMSNVAGAITLNSNAGVTAIINAAGNGVGNIGTSSSYFNTVFAKATSAQYADLAECYLADAAYEPGTVLSFGGTSEVTKSIIDADPTVAGVISANPAYRMNSGLEGEHIATVALMGRVPVKVVGAVTPGALMVSAGHGHARAELAPAMGAVIGKALQAFDGESGIIEIVVGRL
jgi:hypothetical protein